jgi:REP element-mobilizing transposase RayT
MDHHKGWYSRGYLPHFDQPGAVQAITFRLADSVPAAHRAAWQAALALEEQALKRAKIQDLLDASYGSCALRDARVARAVEEALLFYDGRLYRLLAWVVMPNHVHALIEAMVAKPLPEIVRRWKSFTAREANRLLGRTGAFWCRDYYDRYIRDARHMERAISYIHDNPRKAGLVERAKDWPFGSARTLEGECPHAT